MLGHVVHIPKKILLMYGVFNDRHRGITKAVFPKVMKSEAIQFTMLQTFYFFSKVAL